MCVPTTGFKTSFGCDRLQSLWICVLGKKDSQRASARFRALFASGLDYKLFARSRYKTGLETSCSKIQKEELIGHNATKGITLL